MKYDSFNIIKGYGECLGTNMMHIKLRMRREQ